MFIFRAAVTKPIRRSTLPIMPAPQIKTSARHQDLSSQFVIFRLPISCYSYSVEYDKFLLLSIHVEISFGVFGK
ncbi:hypothetical protein ACFLX1_01905 [Chloroflexota bacterium]